MSVFTEYITKDGDRLDNICFAAYGNAFDWTGIIRANPNLPIQDVYPAGIRLVIPIVETEPTTVTAASLPPWKR